MAITAQMVKELREKTGVGMMDCKTALNETNGDMEAAVDWLRTKGLAKAAKKAGRVAVEGLIAVAGSGDRAAMIELNSETDFVARNEQFQALAKSVAEAALKTDGKRRLGAEGAACRRHDRRGAITDAVATIGENMTLRRAAVLSVESGRRRELRARGDLAGPRQDRRPRRPEVLRRQGEARRARPAARDARRGGEPARRRRRAASTRRRSPASAPSSPSRRANPASPTAIIEKMVEGRLRKFYEESTLLKQAFVIDSERTVETVLKDAAKDRRRRGRRSPISSSSGSARASSGRRRRPEPPQLARKRKIFEGADVTCRRPCLMRTARRR